MYMISLHFLSLHHKEEIKLYNIINLTINVHFE